MKAKSLFYLLVALVASAVSLSACRAKEDATAQSVPYQVADRYFVNNNLTALPPLKITTQSEFDRCFGMATVMGPGGTPTPVDFSRQFVIAVTQPVTDRATELTARSLRRSADGRLLLTYRLKQGERRSYTIRPLLMVIVDKKYEGEVTAEAVK